MKLRVAAPAPCLLIINPATPLPQQLLRWLGGASVTYAQKRSPPSKGAGPARGKEGEGGTGNAPYPAARAASAGALLWGAENASAASPSWAQVCFLRIGRRERLALLSFPAKPVSTKGKNVLRNSPTLPSL